MPIQSPKEFLAATIPAEVRNNPAHSDSIEIHLNNLEPASNLTDSDRIKKIYDRGVAQDASAERADMIEGIHNGCRFFSNLALETGNQKMGNAAQLVSSGTQMVSAYSALASATKMAACVNPIATAALAAYTIFSTFRRKKRKGDPFAEAVMQNLAFISNQIHTMHADMFRGFEKSFEYHRATLELISDGFRAIIQGQDALYQHTTNLHNIILNELKSISWYVQVLGDTLIAGQEAISLQPFSDLLMNADDILSGVTTENRSAHIEQTASSLKHWSIHPNGKATNPIHTGIKFFSYTPRKPAELYAIINKVINPFNPYNIQEWQGMLAHIVKNQLGCGMDKNINVDALFNPQHWLEATSRYLVMRRAYPELVRDPDNHIITSIIAGADNQIAWELEKRHSVKLYTSVFDLYEKGIQQIQKMLRDLMFQKVQERHSDISLPLDQLLKQYVDLMCVNPMCSGETSVIHYMPDVLPQPGTNDIAYDILTKGYCGIGGAPLYQWANTQGFREFTLYGGYSGVRKPQALYHYPMPIHHNIFALAERLGLITIHGEQKISPRQPKETAWELITLFNYGINTPLSTIHSYEIDEVYTLKAIINGVERILQIDEFLTNTRTNTKTFVQKPAIPDIDNSIAQVRDIINVYLTQQRNEVIERLSSDVMLNQAFKDEALASVDASNRLLSALMADWPVSIRQNTYVSMNDSSKIMQHLENRNNLTWQELVDGLQNPQYGPTKNHNLYVVAASEDSNFNDGYLTEIKELHQMACQIRDNPPVAPIVEQAPVVTNPADLVLALIETINEQSRQIAALAKQDSVKSAQIDALTSQMQQMFAVMMHQQGQGSSSSSRMQMFAGPSGSAGPRVTSTPNSPSNKNTLN